MSRHDRIAMRKGKAGYVKDGQYCRIYWDWLLYNIPDPDTVDEHDRKYESDFEEYIHMHMEEEE